MASHQQLLHEWCQQHGRPNVHYHWESCGPSHEPVHKCTTKITFLGISFEAEGKSKQEAKEKCAETILSECLKTYPEEELPLFKLDCDVVFPNCEVICTGLISFIPSIPRQEDTPVFFDVECEVKTMKFVCASVAFNELVYIFFSEQGCREFLSMCPFVYSCDDVIEKKICPHVIDINTLLNKKYWSPKVGLRTLCRHFLKKDLKKDKKLSCSFREGEKLTSEQIDYVATDSRVLMEIWKRIIFK